MKKPIIVLLLVFMVGLFAGCPGEDLEPKHFAIAVSSQLSPEIDLTAAIAHFRETYPNITITLTSFDPADIPNLVRRWAAGDAPIDLYIGGDLPNLSTAVRDNVLEPLDDLLDAGGVPKDKILGGFIRDVYFKRPDGAGGYFPMLPFMGEAFMLGVNTDVFKKAGFWRNERPLGPASFDEQELGSLFRKLKQTAPDVGLLENWEAGSAFYNYVAPLLALGRSYLEADQRGFDVTSENAKKWMRTLKSLYNTGLLITADSKENAVETWIKGRSGSFFGIQSRIMELAAQPGRPLTIVGFSAWPGSESNGSIIRTRAVWIPVAANSRTLARSFIREEIFSKSFQQSLFNTSGWLPALRDAYGEGLKKFREYGPLFLSIADNSQSIPLWVDLLPYIDIFEKYMNEVIQGTKTVEEAFAAIETESANLDFTDQREVFK